MNRLRFALLSILACLLPCALAQQSRKVAITVDDLPGAVPGTDSAMGDLADLISENHRICQALQNHKAPAIGFVIQKKLQVSGERDARARLLEEWLASGFGLGNHTYSHAHFSASSLEQFEDETVRRAVVALQLLAARGKSERYFRHPALDTSATPETEAVFEGFLQERGYKIAPVTVENADYAFNDVLADVVGQNDEAVVSRTRAEYIAHTQAMFRYVEDASKSVLGREIPQVWLIHDNEINAELLDTLRSDLERRGYSFVSLDSAMTDPAYATPDPGVGLMDRCYLCWRDRLKLLSGPTPTRGPSPPAWITTRSHEIRHAHGE
jgi:peptidoglycan/xylan/chitin deacetylase (PgdA/CDA1 family)